MIPITFLPQAVDCSLPGRMRKQMWIWMMRKRTRATVTVMTIKWTSSGRVASKHMLPPSRFHWRRPDGTCRRRTPGQLGAACGPRGQSNSKGRMRKPSSLPDGTSVLRIKCVSSLRSWHRDQNLQGKCFAPNPGQYTQARNPYLQNGSLGNDTVISARTQQQNGVRDPFLSSAGRGAITASTDSTGKSNSRFSDSLVSETSLAPEHYVTQGDTHLSAMGRGSNIHTSTKQEPRRAIGLL